MTVQIGVKAKDRITGFEGIVTGRAEYITGCAQLLVAPPMKADGTITDGRWIDEQRLEVVDSTPIVLDNGTTPGCDIPAPVR